MAVKQKVVEHSGPIKEPRLQIILRTLQDISAKEGLRDKLCTHIVMSLGVAQIPSEPASYVKFIDDLKKIQDILANECSDQKQVFNALKALYDEISNPSKDLSPAMSIVLQLIHENNIPDAVKYILNAGYPDQNIEKALFTLCSWMPKCNLSRNLGPLVLALMKGLEAEQHYEILTEVTLATIEPLFKMLMFEQSRKAVGPVVLYMLSRSQHKPEIFQKIIPHIHTICKYLDNEKSESSSLYLQKIVELCIALIEHLPGKRDNYDGLNQHLEKYCSRSEYKQSLLCNSWGNENSTFIPNRCSIGKVGLNNLGNTCYMNSVLQALFMTKMFRNEVLLYDKKMLTLFSKLQVLFTLLQYSKKFSLSPSEILSSSRPPGFLPGHQHDSSEFLGFLLDTLHEQEKTSAGHSSNNEEAGATAVASLPTVVQQSFGGRTLTISRCGECATKSERVDNFRDLQLSFPTHSDNQSVQTLLDYYLQPEKLNGDNQYHCDICNRLTDGERITRIIDAPARLILTLKHFRYDQSLQQRTKLLQVVKLDQFIALGAYQYELYAAVVHCGSSVDSGHYYTFAKDKDDWYKFNDCSVMKTTFEDLCKLKPPETPYILFYSREDMLDPENLPSAILSPELKNVLIKDQSEVESERKLQPVKLYNLNRNDDPPPPGCGGGGFAATSGNMYVC